MTYLLQLKALHLFCSTAATGLATLVAQYVCRGDVVLLFDHLDRLMAAFVLRC
jgi:hypothetical protein